MFMWSPPASTRLATSVTIAGTEYKSKVMSCKVHGYATTSAGFAEVMILNQSGAYSTTFNVGDVIKIYADYASGTTQIFEGKIQAPSLDSMPFPAINITALDYAGDALKKMVSKVYTTPTDAGQVFVDLITDYLVPLGHTATSTVQAGYARGNGIVTNTGYLITPTWQNKPLLECLKDLVGETEENYTFNCDFTKSWQFFEKGAVYNTVDAIVHGGNLLPRTFKWTKDRTDTYNKVTIIGASINGVPLTATAGTGDLELIRQDTNISDWSTLHTKAQSVLNTLQTDEFKGEAKCSIMSTLQPGDSIYVFNPDYNIQEEEYVTEYIHEFGQKGISTYVFFQEKGRRTEGIASFLMDNLNRTKNQIISDNPYGLKNVIFLGANSTDFPTLSGITISNGVLITTSTGTAKTRTITVSSNVTRLYLKPVGEDLPNISLTVSFDNQISTEPVTRETEYTPIAAGSTITVTVSENASTAKCVGLGLYFT